MPHCHSMHVSVHMYTQPHSHYSSVPCCLVHVTLEVSHWHLRKKIGYYIMAESGLRDGTTLICFQTHVPLLVLSWFSDPPLSSSFDWSGYCCEEISPSTCWKIGPIRYKKYLDLPTHLPLTQHQPNGVYVYTCYRQ